MTTPNAESVLGDLVDALHDDLRYEVSNAPDVQRSVRAALDLLGPNYAGYCSAWWLQIDGSGARLTVEQATAQVKAELDRTVADTAQIDGSGTAEEGS